MTDMDREMMLNEHSKVKDSFRDAQIDFNDLYSRQSWDVKLIRRVAQTPTLVNKIISYAKFLDQFRFYEIKEVCLNFLGPLA